MKTTDQLFIAKYTFSAGALVRGAARTSIKNLAFKNNVQCEMEEDKGFFSSFRIKLTGPKYKLVAIMNQFDAWMDQVNRS